MRIAVLDDDKIFTDQIYNYIGFGSDMVKTYLSPTELIEDISKGIRYDLLFCDIIMEPMNGIEVGRQLRAYDKNMYLVYLTSNLEYAPMGYEVKAYRYLLKPVDVKQLKQVLSDIKDELSESGKLMFDTVDGSFLVAEDSILYIEAMDKEIKIVCQDDSFFVRKSLNDMEEELAQYDYSRIHRKYLVNLSHVVEFDKSRITLDNGECLSVSRRKAAEFNDEMIKFLEKGK